MTLRPHNLRIFHLVLGASILFSLPFFAPSGATAQDKSDPLARLEGLLKRIEDVENYQFIFEFTEFDDKGKKHWREMEFWHKSPDFLLFRVLDGDDKGGLIVFNPDVDKKRFFVKKGRLPMPPMSIDNPLFDGTFETEWASDLKDLIALAKSGSIAFKGTVDLNGSKVEQYEILPGKNKDGITRTLLWVDPKDNLVVKYQDFIGERMKDDKHWKKYRLNPGLKNGDFEIKLYPKNRLK